MQGPGVRVRDDGWRACLTSVLVQHPGLPLGSHLPPPCLASPFSEPCSGWLLFCIHGFLQPGDWLAVIPALCPISPSSHHVSPSWQSCPRRTPPPPRDALSLWLQKEKLSAQASLKRHTSLNDLSLTRDEQEIEFLRLQVLEQQHVIDDLSLVRLLSAGALGVAPSDTVPGLARRLRAG